MVTRGSIAIQAAAYTSGIASDPLELPLPQVQNGAFYLQGPSRRTKLAGMCQVTSSGSVLNLTYRIQSPLTGHNSWSPLTFTVDSVFIVSMLVYLF